MGDKGARHGDHCASVDAKGMGRLVVLVSFMTAAIIGGLLSGPVRAQNASPLAGIWTLNRSLSEFPPDIGFNMSWTTTASGDGAGANGGGRGRQGSAGGGDSRGSTAPFSARPESYEDARRRQLLTAEARNPPLRQIIVDAPAAVTITNELGQSRTLHPGKEDSIELQGVPIGVTSKRDGDRFVVVYHVAPNRDLQYSYSYAASPARLVVDVQFLERGAGDKARRVYEPGAGTEALISTATALPPASSSSQAKPESFDQRPGAELKGLTTLGILVEDLGADAVACRLSHDAIESALSQRLTAGGFTVRKNSDDDTYLYVNIITSRLPDGTCVSRYDAFLYTYATAKLSHHDQPVLVQVSLMHRGGIDASMPTNHAAVIMRGLENYVALFITQIRNANK